MLSDQHNIIFLNGEFINQKAGYIDPLSQTLHYGYGVFEGLRSYETEEGPQIFKAEKHFERLAASARQMRFPLKYTVADLIEISYEILKRNNLTDAYIRPLVFSGPHMGLLPSADPQLIIAAWKWGRLLGDNLLEMMTSSYRRPVAHSDKLNAKICGFYAISILAISEARANGFHDALMLDEDGMVAGGSGTNIFMEKNEVLYTPSKGKILTGITRSTIMELAAELGIKVVEKRISLDELKASDGAFLTGTASEVVGIQSIDKQRLKMQWEDTLGHMLSRKYRKLVTNSLTEPVTLI